MNSAIGGRVRGLIDSVSPRVTQAALSEQIEMTPDALSRALNGTRGFAASELARISERFNVSMYWLATGQEDPGRTLLAARHEYDHETGTHKRVDLERSLGAREAIELVYRQAFPEPARPDPLPFRTAAELRALLGQDFAPNFAERIEQLAGIDVVRIEGLHSDLSLVVSGRRCIALQPTPNWFYQNWSMAHELGHLVLGDQTDPERLGAGTEPAANRFAAELLLPEAQMRSVDWTRLTPEEFAKLLWQWGVSTKSIEVRLRSLHIRPSAELAELLTQTTQSVLRRHLQLQPTKNLFSDEMGDRMQAASTRRFPGELLDAHSRGVAEGRLHAGSLAWMLGVEESQIELGREAEVSAVGADDLAELLGLSR